MFIRFRSKRIGEVDQESSEECEASHPDSKSNQTRDQFPIIWRLNIECSPVGPKTKESVSENEYSWILSS